MLLQSWELFYQHLSEVVLELLSNKCVKDGADAEIKVGEVPSDVKDITPFLWFLTGFDVVQKQDDIKGSPEQEKQDHNEKYQPDRLELVGELGWYDGDCNPDVAVDDHNQGEEQEQKELQVKASNLQLSTVTGQKRKLVTVRSVFNVLREGCVKDHLLHTCRHADQPHQRTGDPCVPEVPHPPRAQRVDHRKVPVEGEQSEEEDGAVDAQVVHGSNHPAHDVTEDPVGQLHVDGHEGQAAHEDDGGQDQVQQQNVGHRGQLLKPAAVETEATETLNSFYIWKTFIAMLVGSFPFGLLIYLVWEWFTVVSQL